ncbi:MAG: CocE/NonD family hydrolase [Burkholderiales bacterium]|nr:CocE/NonD family hydrolase [Burkholderiales bacterium]
MTEAHDVMAPMRDGVRIALDVFRPDAAGRFPALLAMSPYGKGIQSLPIAHQPDRSPIHHTPIEAGSPAYFAARGYVHVIADVRGTGQSEGEYLGWMSRQEAEDGHDLVEWIAAQPWCDGNVGMVGISYFGTVQLVVAAQQPPHLKAIMPWNAPADFYRESTHHGGILQSFFHYLYVQRICAERSTSVTLKRLGADERARLLAELKTDPDLRINPELFTFADNPGKAPCLFDILANPHDGPFYWERSPYTMYDRIRIPFYARSGWWAYAHMHLVGAFRNYNGIAAPKKLEIDAPVVEKRPLTDDYNAEVLRWYDYWLKGIDTGIMDEPPIRFFVNGSGEWRRENEWPLARTAWTRFYLRRWEELATEPEEAMDKPDVFVQQPPDETVAIASVQYLSARLEEDLEITGPAALYLHAAIDQDDTNWIVSLRDVAPNGKQVELTKGFLKASHRALDAARSEPHTPYHPHVDPRPVTPGQICEYAIALAPLSNVFKVGHRIKLVISCMDHARARDYELAPESLGRTHAPWHLCSSRTTVHKVFHDRERPSHLLLPVIPAR